MKRNNIWMRYLLFGAFSLFITFAFSCKRAEYSQKGIFVFVNNTNYNISAGHQVDPFLLMPNSTVRKEQVQPSGKKATALGFQNPLTLNNQFVVKIGDKCIINTKGSINSIINIASYTSEKIDESTYKFTYTFTEADYNRAVACP